MRGGGRGGHRIRYKTSIGINWNAGVRELSDLMHGVDVLGMDREGCIAWVCKARERAHRPRAMPEACGLGLAILLL